MVPCGFPVKKEKRGRKICLSRFLPHIGCMRRMPAGTKALAFWHFPKRPVNSSKAFQHKYIVSFIHSLKTSKISKTERDR